MITEAPYCTQAREHLRHLELPAYLAGSERILRMKELVITLEHQERTKMRLFTEQLLLRMISLDASDIDMGGQGCAGRVWYRVHGLKTPDANFELSVEETDLMLLNLLNKNQMELLETQHSLDFSYTIVLEDGTKQRFRSSMYQDLNHLALNMRRITNEIRSFKSFEFHPEVARALSLSYLKYGLTLVTGITGSGKSTTLDTIIDANNRSSGGHIVIIASPVELVHEPKRCLVRHREVGRDVSSFRAGAVESLRQDPDIIMIGELRDEETIRTALEVTDSGHKTFSTLHTASATESVDRIIGEVEVNQQERVRQRLADVLTCVISQKLMPSTDGKRVLAKEVLLATPAVRAAIRNNNLGELYQMMNEGGSMGMQTLEQDLKRLYRAGRITLDNALGFANNKTRMRELLGLNRL